MTTTVVRDDGVTVTTTASPWTPEDRSLMLAWRTYQSGIHERCGQPIEVSTHPFMEGWYEQRDDLICWACTAMQDKEEDGTLKPFTLPVVVDLRDHDADPLPPRPIVTSSDQPT